MIPAPEGVAEVVIRWQAVHGRQHLPWQNTRDPYRVWLSEIMLQQTQVSTVLDYYQRFLTRFPDVHVLAAADLDDVLSAWSGLGYYSRARNLHRCACEVVAHHAGEFPRSAAQLQALPGIGRSTAAAIAAFCFSERVAILDGNVKRVLSRVLAFDADLAVPANTNLLWDLATGLLPDSSHAGTMPRYTQGLMDLGATVCARRAPACEDCPLQDLCGAKRLGNPDGFPVKSRKLKRSSVSLWLLHATTEDATVWLEKRPTPGVWAGLYCLPVFESREALEIRVPARYRGNLHDSQPFLHVLTHKDLHLHRVQVTLPGCDLGSDLVAESGAWFPANEWSRLGLPAPIRKLLNST
jgi:A/G-specific adenine glycosylase